MQGGVSPGDMPPIIYYITSYGFFYFALIVLGLNFVLFLTYQVASLFRSSPVKMTVMRKYTLISIAGVLIYFIGILILSVLF